MEPSLVFIFIGNFIPVLLIDIVFIFLDQWPIVFLVTGVDLPSPGGWLKAGLCLYINGFVYHFVPRIQVSSWII